MSDMSMLVKVSWELNPGPGTEKHDLYLYSLTFFVHPNLDFSCALRGAGHP